MRVALISVLLLIVSGAAGAAERKALENVNTEEFSNETQRTLSGGDTQHLTLVWWVPKEYWATIAAKTDGINVAQKQSLLDAFSGISLLAVVQADNSALGNFDFYSKDEVKNGLFIEFTPEDGSPWALQPVENIGGEVEKLLSVLKPILSKAAGNLGRNMHFLVLSDETKNGERLADPYEAGMWDIRLRKRDDTELRAQFELPLNALYVPRQCPNGKDAHISWNYCPWSGEPLPE